MKKILFLINVLLLALCVGSPLSQAGGLASEQLKQEASRFWQARVDEDWGTVHGFLQPQNRDNASHRDAYIKWAKEKEPFRYPSAEVRGAEVSGDLGWVDVTYQVRPSAFFIPPRTITKWELWRKQEEMWLPTPEAIAKNHPSTPPQVRSTVSQAALSMRVGGYWQAKMGKEWGQVYDFLEPDYRADFDRESFLNRKSLYSYKDYRAEWVEAMGDEGRVKISYTFKYDDPAVSKMEPQRSSMIENWVKVGGEWYRKMPRKGDASGS